LDLDTERVFDQLLSVSSQRGSAFLILLDPDAIRPDAVADLAALCTEGGADAFLVGGSLTFSGDLDEIVLSIKRSSTLPVILFPGNATQISENADAILFLSLLSSRNADFLIGEHVKAAPLVHRLSLEVVPTAYLLVESGTLTSVQFMTQSLPLPRDKVDLAVAHALAGKYLGMRLIYLEAGSGASMAVPTEMIEAVSSATSLPVAVGGGVRSPDQARDIAKSGARFVVVGNALEKNGGLAFVEELSSAIHHLA
jgi:putative glycerol-1-phosphate prenyltransferase